MFKIAPSILAADFGRLGECIRDVEEAGADLIHLDVMDGHFVPNITVGVPVVESIRKWTNLPLDVHLMIEHPLRFIPDFVRAGADRISVHVEVEPHLHRTLGLIADHGVCAGVAVNPATPLSLLDCVLGDVQFILLMSVNPGFGGQKFIPSSLTKIQRLKAKIVEERFNTQIEVDGGIGPENFYQVAQAGADILVAGSSIFGSPDPGAVVRSWSQAGCMSPEKG